LKNNLIIKYKKNTLNQLFHFIFLLYIENDNKIEEIEDIFDNNQEKWYTIASQVFIPFLIAGFGMVATGLVLERVKVCYL